MSTRLKVGVVCVAAGFALMTYSARAGSKTYDFSTDPSLDPAIQLASTAVDPNWLATGGNPGGFLVISYAGTYQNTHIIFPDLDPGKVVTAFTFECDLRVGNGTARPADGFSVNFARSYDPMIAQFADTPGRGYRGDLSCGECPACENASLPETGTLTGIAISFDTWSGNTYNDGADIEGIMVAVDGKTLPGPTNARGFPMATRNGAVGDATSMQTGPRDDAFWTAGGDILTPEAWVGLGWAKLKIVMDDTGKLTVIWKGTTLLNAVQTTYFPTPGRLVFGGRTGGSHEQTHVDNIVLTTTAVAAESQPPTDPTNLRAVQVGARRVALQWDPSVEQPDPQARLAYQVSRDGKVIASVVTTTNYVDAPGPDQDSWNQLAPGSAHTYSVLAKDLNENKSGSVTLAVTTVAEVAVPGYFKGQVYTNVTGVVVYDAALGTGWMVEDPNFPNSPGKEGWWLTGLNFNQPSGAFGDNYGLRFAGTLAPPKTGQYRFFVRSDDSSQFFLNPSGAALPDVMTATPIAQEDDCCDAFAEPGQAENAGTAGTGTPTGTFPTSAAIALNAGTKYGFVWLVKEGTSGDNGQVAWRLEGDTTPAANLSAIGGAFVEPATGGSLSDPGGASVTITQDPVDVTAGANSHLNLWVAATTTSPWGYPAAYQWYKGGAPLMNANATNCYVDVLTPADAGIYKVWVSVPGAGSFSGEATVTVNADATPPTINVSGLHGSLDLTHVTVTFSEPVTAPTATTAANYTMEPTLAVTGAERVDLYTILLTTAAQVQNTKYTLTVNNVQDNAGLSIAANTKADWMSFVAVGTVGNVLAEIYDGNGGAGTAGQLPGTTVAELLSWSGYPASPDVVTNITAFNTRLYYPDDTHETFGARMTGLITPTESGNFRFFITSDDSSELWLSTDTTEAHLVKIAEETGCCNAFTEPDSPRTSAPKALVGGTSYLLRGIYKEGGGGDYLQVAWRKEGNPAPASSLAPIPGNYDPWASVPSVTTQPVSVAVDKGATATFTVDAALGLRPVSYQWQRLGSSGAWANITGETATTLTIANVDASKLAAFRAVASNTAGSGTSGQALLTLKNSFVIEAEDFNYEGGKHLAAADTMPYLNGAYRDLGAVYQVDYNSDSGFDSNSYRSRTKVVGGVTVTNFVDGHNVQQNDNGGYSDRAGWKVTSNYKIGWTGGGQWLNYTRQIPQGTYMVYAALSHGDPAGNAGGTKGNLGLVSGDPTTTSQTYTSIGVFDGGATGGWGSNALIPMQGPSTNGVSEVVTLGGLQTLRFYPVNGDYDWFMLVPSEASTAPTLTPTYGAGGALQITFSGGTLVSSDTAKGTYAPVEGATSPYNVDTKAAAARFYQVRQ